MRDEVGARSDQRESGSGREDQGLVLGFWWCEEKEIVEKREERREEGKMVTK